MMSATLKFAPQCGVGTEVPGPPGKFGWVRRPDRTIGTVGFSRETCRKSIDR